MIRLAAPSFGTDEEDAVRDVLRSGMLVQGARVEAFEGEAAKLCARKHAIAVTNGTEALLLALAVLDVGPDDRVIVPDLTWPSPGHAVLLRGAEPVLADVDPEEWNLDARPIHDATAVIAVDQFGVPARLSEHVPVIEDAACAIGSVDDTGRPCGSRGVLSTLSFHPRKIVTTGEGGMVLTDDDALAHRLRVLRNHGQSAPGVFEEASGNARMTELQAAIGLVQLRKLPALLAHRRTLAAAYEARLGDRERQKAPPGSVANHQTFGVVLDARDAQHRDAILAKTREAGVECGKLSYALHRLPAFGSQPDTRFPVASRLVDLGCALPLHGGMTVQDCDRVVDALEAAEKGA